MRRTLGAGCAGLLLAALGAGCAGSDAATPAAERAAATSAAPSSAPAVDPNGFPLPTRPDCAADDGGQLVQVTTSEGNGAGVLVFGAGDQGVVLSPQGDGDLCRWLPYARELADRYRVALYEWEVPYREMPQIAANALRDAGVRDVVLVGASLGGTVSMAEAHAMRPRPAGVAALGSPVVASNRNVDARPGLRAWRGPLLLLSSEDDAWLDRAEAAIARRLHPGPERVLLVPGAAHGVDLFEDPAQGRIRRALDEFLARSLG